MMSLSISCILCRQNQLNAALSCKESPNKRHRSEEQAWIASVLEHCNREEKVVVKLLCGADVIQSFNTPGLWLDEDVSIDVQKAAQVGGVGMVIKRAGTL